jgi:uncharacterized membrane protein YbhN (UPF0104 family)
VRLDVVWGAGRRWRPALAAAAVAAVAAVGVGAWAVSGSVRSALIAAAAADPRQALVAGLGFVVSLAATAFGFRAAFVGLGATVDRVDACARYGAGSLVNTFLPAQLGDGVRTVLFARSLPAGEGRALRAAGTLGALSLARMLVQAIAVGCGAAIGIVPVWPVLVLGGVTAAGAAAAGVLHRHGRGVALARLVAATVALARRPRLGLEVLGWSVVALAARLLATAAVLSAVSVPAPLRAALVIGIALDVAAAFPLTPGGFGITGVAVSVALASRGVDLRTGLAAGLVFHAVETAASLGFAGTCLALVRRPRLAAQAAFRVAAGFLLFAVPVLLELT